MNERTKPRTLQPAGRPPAAERRPAAAGGVELDAEHERSRLHEVIERALAEARRLGASAAEAGAGFEHGLNVEVRLGELEKLEYTRDHDLAVTVYLGQAKGTASCADFSAAAVRETVAKALAIARHTGDDPANGLAEPELLAGVFPDFDLYHPEPFDQDKLLARALTIERAGLDADPRISNSEGAGAAQSLALGAYGNTQGFLASEWGTHYEQSLSLIAGDDGGMQRDGWWDVKCRSAKLDEPEITGVTAARRTVARLGSRQVPTAVVPVLFTAETARSLIGHLLGALSGGAQYRKSSFLLDSIDQPVFPEWFEIVEHPLLKGGVRSSAFDGDGVATVTRPLVRGGRIERYLLSCYSARRLAMQTTANAGGVRNLIVTPGRESRETLIAGFKRGLIVTELMGQGVNPVTGDYSRGAAGLWVENGVPVHPVDEVTIAGNLRDMFRNIAALGNDPDPRLNIQTPSILVSEMTVAGH